VSTRPKDAGPAELPTSSILDVLLATRAVGDAEAIVDATTRLTYSELWQDMASTAGSLWRSGVGPGDRVAVCLPNDVASVVAFLALGPLFSLQSHTGCVLIGSLDHPSTGGAGCPDDLKAEYRHKFGVDVVRTYGLTELPTVAAREDWDAAAPPGSSGKVLPYLHAEVVDGEGRPMPLGEVGEIWLSAATEGEWAGYYTPMLGEWVDGGLVRSHGAALKTGDIGHLDADGYVSIVDRPAARTLLDELRSTAADEGTH
jgi:acyl-CoA synthetase (AMP-forming)/AMP-acid ligase II